MNTFRKTLFAYSRLTTGAAAILLASTAAQAETEERALVDFDAIEVGGAIDVELTQGTEFSVVVETGEDGELEDVITDVRNGTLHIEREWRDRRGWGWPGWDGDSDIVVYVTLPTLTELEVSGGSGVRTAGTFTGDELDITTSGGSEAELDVIVDRLELTTSGGSDVEISGTANYLEADSSGGSDLEASKLVAVEVDANSSGGSDLAVNVTETLYAHASGGSDIDYEGDPKNRDIDTSGEGDVRRR
jgi:hypothetical protein